MRKVALWLAPAALVAVGAGGGFLLGAARVPAAPVAMRCGPAEHATVQVATRGGVSEAAVRRVVEDELAAGRAAASAAEAPAAAAPAGDPAAFDRGMQRVHQAIAQRRWTREDATALGRALETTSDEQRSELLHALVPALNRGEIKLAYRGDLF